MNERKELTRLRQAAERMGGQAAMADRLGYKDRRNVSPWFRRVKPVSVPPADCVQIESLTFGEFKCEELRPDLSWRRVRDRSWRGSKEGRPLLDVAKDFA